MGKENEEFSIRAKESVVLEFEEDFDNITYEEVGIWVSFKEYYLKHDMISKTKMYKLDDMNKEYVERQERNKRRIINAKDAAKKKLKIKMKFMAEEQYANNPAYRLKVDTLILYAGLSKNLSYSYLLHHRHSDLKAGMYISCLLISMAIGCKQEGIFSRLCCSCLV